MAGEVQRLRTRFRFAGTTMWIGREPVQVGTNDKFDIDFDRRAADLDAGAVSFAVANVLVTDYHVVSADVRAITVAFSEHGARGPGISEGDCFTWRRAWQIGKNVSGNARRIV